MVDGVWGLTDAEFLAFLRGDDDMLMKIRKWGAGKRLTALISEMYLEERSIRAGALRPDERAG